MKRRMLFIIVMCLFLFTSVVANAQNNPPMPSSEIQEKKLETELEEVSKEIETLKSELEKAQSELAAVTKERDKLKSRCRNYRKKYEKASSEIEKLEAEILSLKQSSKTSADNNSGISGESTEKTKVVTLTDQSKPTVKDESDSIRSSIRSHVSSEYDKTTVDSITINNDYGKGSGYIALVYLTWDVKNSAETSKKMLRMYSDDLSATIAEKYSSVNEIAVFWTVPYLTNNTSKWAYSCEGGKAYCTDIATAF